jgi:hypothetical protein
MAPPLAGERGARPLHGLGRSLVAAGAVLGVLSPATRPAEAEPARSELGPRHQLSVGFGPTPYAYQPISINCMDDPESGYECPRGHYTHGGPILGPSFHAAIPVRYGYRLFRWLSFGVGIHTVVGSGIRVVDTFMIGVTTGPRLYAVPDWLYFEANIHLGYPYTFALEWVVGVSIPVHERVLLVIEPLRMPLYFIDDLELHIQVAAGLEVRI